MKPEMDMWEPSWPVVCERLLKVKTLVNLLKTGIIWTS